MLFDFLNPVGVMCVIVFFAIVAFIGSFILKDIEYLFTIAKCATYLVFAILIFANEMTNDSINISNLFTFVLALFEGLHNAKQAFFSLIK